MRRRVRSASPDVLGLILLAQALTVVIGGAPGSPEYLPVRVAESHGDFARESLNVTVRTTRSESGAAEALAQGQADLAATSLEAILRFGQRKGSALPRLVFGLTAAPPVAIVASRVHADRVSAVSDLAGMRVGFAAPGGSEQTWLQGVLGRARLTVAQVTLVSLGSRGIVSALETGDVHAAVVSEPLASALLQDGRAIPLADLRSPPSARQALGTPTVSAGVFARADAKLDAAVTAFARALLAAERRMATMPIERLAERLPRPVVGIGSEFERTVSATRSSYLANGVVERGAMEASLELIRTHVPLPTWITVPGPEAVLHLDPLRRALRSRPPS